MTPEAGRRVRRLVAAHPDLGRQTAFLFLDTTGITTTNLTTAGITTTGITTTGIT